MANSTPPPPGTANYALDDHGEIAVTYPVSSVVVVTEDRLRVRLMEHWARISGRQEWIAPAGLLVSLGASLVTSTFKEALGLSGDVWHAMFVIGCLGSAVWLGRSLFKLFKQSATLDDLVGTLKADTARAERVEAPSAKLLPAPPNALNPVTAPAQPAAVPVPTKGGGAEGT